MTGGSYRLVGDILLDTQKAVQSVTALPIKVPYSVRQSLPFGTGGGTYNLAVVRSDILAAGASVTFDIYTGTDLLDPYGDAAPFRVLRHYAFWVDRGGDASGVTIGGAASNAHPLFFADASDKKTAYPGGAVDTGGSPAGIAVTSSAKNILITNNGAVAATYGLILLGSRQTGGTAMGVLGLTYP